MISTQTIITTTTYPKEKHMKKTLMAIMTLSMISSAAYSQSIGEVATGSTVSSTALTAAVLDAVTETVLSPFALSSASTLAAAKIEIEAVQEDANDFLAGDDKTDALNSVIVRIREDGNDDIADASDEEIAIEILNLEI